MTVPVECLVSAHIADLDPASHHIVHDLTHQLYSAKEAFLDPRATRAIIDQLNGMLEKVTTTSVTDVFKFVTSLCSD